jgi:hypothetical protein
MPTIERFASWCTEPVGSTRGVGLLRMALAAIILIRYDSEVAFFAHGDAAHTVLAVYFFVLTPLMFVGAYTRLVVPLVALMLAVMYFGFGFMPGKVGWNHHHSYILMISVVFLSFTPCGRSYSIDRYREIVEASRRGVAPRPERGRLWGTRLIGLQISALYFWTAYDKSDWAFVSGQRLEQIMVWHYSGSVVEPWVTAPLFLVGASVMVLVGEYLLAVAIHVRRLQPVAIPAALAMHAAFYMLLPVETYSITMIALYLVVVNADALHRFLDRLQGHEHAYHRL